MTLRFATRTALAALCLALLATLLLPSPASAAAQPELGLQVVGDGALVAPPPLPDGYGCSNWPPVLSNDTDVEEDKTLNARNAASEACRVDYRDYDDQKGDFCEWLETPRTGWRCLIREDDPEPPLECPPLPAPGVPYLPCPPIPPAEPPFPCPLSPPDVPHQPCPPVGCLLSPPDVRFDPCPPFPCPLSPPDVPHDPCPPFPCFLSPPDGYLPCYPEPTEEQRLELYVHAMVMALESYADEHGTYHVEGAGFKGRGTGWAFWEGPNYTTSIASVLEAEGHLVSIEYDLDPNLLSPAEYDIARDLLIYRCKNRVGVFTLEGEGQPSDFDSTWWDEHDCFRYPIDRLNATHFQISDPLPGPGNEVTGIAALRAIEVDKMVTALESYAHDNGTYKVEGAGFRGFGTGWAFYSKAGTDYTFSIASALRSGGHLPPDAAPIFGDVLVYRCNGRVGVFTIYESLAPSADDSTWWTENDCNPYPIEQLDATYFSLSSPLPQ